MEKNQYIVALEIGSSKIVGAIAEKTSAGYLSVRHLSRTSRTLRTASTASCAISRAWWMDASHRFTWV